MNDYQLIINALNKYIHGLDDNDEKTFLSAFTEDAKLEFPLRKLNLEGSIQLKQFLDNFHSQPKNWCHEESTFVVDINGNTAKNKSYWKA